MYYIHIQRAGVHQDVQGPVPYRDLQYMHGLPFLTAFSVSMSESSSSAQAASCPRRGEHTWCVRGPGI